MSAAECINNKSGIECQGYREIMLMPVSRGKNLSPCFHNLVCIPINLIHTRRCKSDKCFGCNGSAGWLRFEWMNHMVIIKDHQLWLKGLRSWKIGYILLLLVDELNDVSSSRVAGKGIRSFLSSLLSIFFCGWMCQKFRNSPRAREWMKKVWLMIIISTFCCYKKRNQNIINYVCLWHSRVLPFGFSTFRLKGLLSTRAL